MRIWIVSYFILFSFFTHAAMNLLVCVFKFICEEVLLVYNRSGLARSSGIYVCSALLGSSKLFSKVIVSIYTPTGCV